MGWRNWADPRNRSYFGLDFAYNTIPNRLLPYDYDAFEAYPGVVEAVVTNLDTGRRSICQSPADENNLLLQATCAIPLMFPIYHLDAAPAWTAAAPTPFPGGGPLRRAATGWWWS